MLYIRRHLVTAVVQGYAHGETIERTAWDVAIMSKTRKNGERLLSGESPTHSRLHFVRHKAMRSILVRHASKSNYLMI